MTQKSWVIQILGILNANCENEALRYCSLGVSSLATELYFKRSHLLTYNVWLGEPFAHSVKTLLTLGWYY